MTYRKALALAALVLTLAVSAFAQSAAGKWTASFDTPVGMQNYTYEFVVDGEKVTGQAVNSQRGAVDIQEGKLSGDTISFVEMLDIQGQSIRIEYTGKISGDEIQFHRQVGDFGSTDFVAKRSQ